MTPRAGSWAALLAALLTSCAGDPQPAEPPPERAEEPSSGQPSSDQPSSGQPSSGQPSSEQPSAEADEGDSPDLPATFAVLSLSESDSPRPSRLPLRPATVAGPRYDEQSDVFDVRYQRVVHPVEAVREALDDRLRRQAEAFAARELFQARCRATLATEHLVSVICTGGRGERGEVPLVADARLLVVRDQRVEEVTLDSMFVPHADLGSRVLTRCRQASRPDSDDSEDRFLARMRCDAVDVMPRTLSRRGLEAWSGDYYYGGVAHAVVPWSDLDRLVLADSALGRLLREAAEVSVVQTPRPAHAVLEGEVARGWALTEAQSLEHTVRQLLALPEALRESALVVSQTGQQHRLAHPEGTPPDHTARVASALGTVPVATQWQQVLEPVAARTQAELTVRRGPWGGPFTTVPPGTQITALLGPLGERQSRIGERGAWVRAAVSPSLEGWLAGGLVRRTEGCQVDPTPFLASRRPQTRQRLVTSVLHAHDAAGAATRVVLFAAAERRHSARRRGASRVELRRLGEDCAVGETLAAWSIPGELLSAGLVRRGIRSGASLMVVHTRDELRVYELGQAQPIHRRALDPQTLVQRGALYEGERSLALVSWSYDLDTPTLRLQWRDGAVHADAL